MIVGVLLQRGEFGADDTRLVWLVLGAFALGLLGTTRSRLLQNGRLRVYLVIVLLSSLLMAAYSAIGKTPKLPRHALEGVGLEDS